MPRDQVRDITHVYKPPQCLNLRVRLNHRTDRYQTMEVEFLHDQTMGIDTSQNSDKTSLFVMGNL